jgi:hypothetical protein
MSRQVIIKTLEQLDVTRMILYARKRLDKSDRSTTDQAFGFGYYRQMALLEPRRSNGICCHRCRGIIAIGEPFAKKNQGGKPYHISCAKALNII